LEIKQKLKFYKEKKKLEILEKSPNFLNHKNEKIIIIIIIIK